MAVRQGRTPLFPPEILEDVRGVGRFLVARRLSLEGGWLTEVEGESEVAHSLRHGLRLVTIIVLAIGQAAAIGAMLSGGGSPLAYQITVQAMAVGFTAIFIMLITDGRH